MRSIQDLSARLNGLSDVRAIAEAIVAEATALADYHDIRVYAVDWERRMCDPIAFTREMLDGDPADAEALLRVAIGEGFTGWVAEHGEPLLINDAIDDERGKTIEGTEDIPESMLLVPMLRRMGHLPEWHPQIKSLPLARRVVSTTGRHQFYTVRIRDGKAEPAFKASGDITSMAAADGYIDIPAQTDVVEAGEIVDVRLF
jgi:hypothetical protein